jgi:hypothetical protein
MEKDKALIILKKTYDILLSIEVESWLTDGTLLGFYREANFIEYDNDIDIAINIRNWNKSILPLMESNGFKVIRVKGTLESGLEYSFKKHGIPVDFFFFYEQGEQFWHSAWLKNIQLKFNYPKFSTKPVVFLGKNFKAPENEEQYLKIKYGENWNIPQAKWHWAFSPKNVKLSNPTLNNRIKYIHEKIKWKIRIFKRFYRALLKNFID